MTVTNLGAQMTTYMLGSAIGSSYLRYFNLQYASGQTLVTDYQLLDGGNQVESENDCSVDYKVQMTGSWDRFEIQDNTLYGFGTTHVSGLVDSTGSIWRKETFHPGLVLDGGVYIKIIDSIEVKPT